MDFLDQYAQHIGELLSWLSNPDTSIPVFKLLQGLAAVLGALVSALGFYKAWRYAENKLGRRLTEFLAQEEEKLVLARDAIKAIRGERSAVKHERPKLFSNHELRKALKHVRKRRFASAETILNDAITRTKEREDLARRKTALHEKQRAMAHLLLGAMADARNDHRAALVHFQTALQIDNHDVEALEYVGLQLLKLGDTAQALAEFEKLAEIAEGRGDALLLAHAYRNCGLAHEAQPQPGYYKANIAYRDAIYAFPQGGPPLDIAYMYELRGGVNIKLGNRGLANQSLMLALTRYSPLATGRTRDSKEAAEGLQRIHAAQAQLQSIQNGAQSTLNDDSTSSPSATAPLFALSDQKPAQQPPGGERPN